MPKRVPQDELDAMREAVGGLSAPASIEEIANALTPKLSRRTLQRRLARLVEQQHLAAQGRGSGRRYNLAGVVNISGRASISFTSTGTLSAELGVSPIICGCAG